MKNKILKTKAFSAIALIGGILVAALYLGSVSETPYDEVLKLRKSSELPIIKNEMLLSTKQGSGTWIYSLSEFRGGEILLYADYVTKRLIGYKWEEGSAHVINIRHTAREMDFSAQFIKGDQEREPLLMGVIRNNEIIDITVSVLNRPPYGKYNIDKSHDVSIFEKEGIRDRYYYVNLEEIPKDGSLIFEVRFSGGETKDYYVVNEYDLRSIQTGRQLYLYPDYTSYEELIIGGWSAGINEESDLVAKYNFFEDGTYISYYKDTTNGEVTGEIMGNWRIENNLLVIIPANELEVEVKCPSLEEVNKEFYGIHLIINQRGLLKVTDDPSID